MTTRWPTTSFSGCGSGGWSRSSATPGTASTGCWRPGQRPTTARRSSSPGTRRWPRSGGRLRQVLRQGRGVRGDVGPGRDPPAERSVRRQARPRAGRGDRRPDRPQRHGRLLPAGGRPAEPVQGRRQRLRADGHRARAAARTCSTGPSASPTAERTRRPRSSSPPTCRSSSTRHRRTRSRWCRPASDRPGRAGARRRGDLARPPRCSTRARRSRCSSGRAPGARRTEVSRSPTLLGAGVAKALLGKDVLPDELPWVTGSIGLLGTRPVLRDDARLRHAADGRLELPVHPVPARLGRQARAPCRSTSTRP